MEDTADSEGEHQGTGDEESRHLQVPALVREELTAGSDPHDDGVASAARRRVHAIMEGFESKQGTRMVLDIDSDMLVYILQNTERFCKSVGGNTDVKKIRVKVNGIACDECCTKLVKVCESLLGLREIHLEGNGEQQRQTRSSAPASTGCNHHPVDDSFSAHPALEEIRMTDLTPEQVIFAAIALSKLPTPNLHVVDIRWSTPQDATAHYFLLRDETPRPPSLPSIPPVLGLFLKSPSLRQLSLRYASISRAVLQDLCEGLGNDVSNLRKLTFWNCQFTGGGSFLAAALRQTLSLEELLFMYSVPDSTFFSGLRDSLPACRTLTCLEMRRNLSSNGVPLDASDLVGLFEGLQRNESVRSLTLPGVTWTNDACDALRRALETNTSIRSLTMQASLDDNTWQRFIPFLRVNATLESLKVEDSALTGSIIPNTAAALDENKGLAYLQIYSLHVNGHDAIKLVGLMNRNTSLKELNVSQTGAGGSASRAAVVALKKNYGLEKWNVRLPFGPRRRLVEGILKLNKAGRRYFLEEPTSIEKGVDVLNQVSDDLDCLFIHLQENPHLCKCGE